MGGLYRADELKAYAFSVEGRRLQIFKIYGHEKPLCIEAPQMITNVQFRRNKSDDTEVIVCSLVQVHLYLLSEAPFSLDKAQVHDLTLANDSSIRTSLFVPELDKTFIASG